MKKIFPTLILIAIVALAAFTLLSPSSNPAPAFQLSNLQGKTIDNGSLKNKVTLINFWFPTCPAA